MKPPRLLLRFFRWYCHPELVDHIEGDLLEEYGQRAKEKGKWMANWVLCWDVLLLFRPGILRNFSNLHYRLNSFDMIQHNVLIAIRNFNRHRVSFIINLTGLSSGLACSLFIYLWVADELSINKFNINDSRLYQVMQNVNSATGVETIEHTQGLLAAALAQEIPEVEFAATVVPPNWFSSPGIISFENTFLKANPQFISKDYFNVFTCPILQGDRNNLLPDRSAVAISENLALKLFHTTENIIGKTVDWNHDRFTGEYHITGVFETTPANSTNQFDLLLTYDLFQYLRPSINDWGNSDPSTFLLLKGDINVESLNEKINQVLKAKYPNSESTLFIQRYSDRYLFGHYDNGKPAGGRIFYVRLVSIVGILILVIACINFTNLSTAKASRRGKEVGIKKVVGAGRKSLVWQYLSESALVTFCSLVIAVCLVYVLIPQFNTITGKSLFLKPDTTMIAGLVCFFLVTSFLAGSYPAFYLSAFSPANVLKGRRNTSITEVVVRKGLVIFQFSISIILIVTVVIAYEQMQYIQSKNLGYKRENIITFDMEGQPSSKLEAFRSELMAVPGVLNAGTYYHNLTGDNGNIRLDWDGKSPDQKVDFINLEVGYDFIETIGIEFKEGRSPTKNANPESQIVLNEKAIQIMGLKDPIGKTVRYWGKESTIVGIAKDFNFESLHEEIKPCFFRVYPIMPKFVVKIQGGAEKQVIEEIGHLYARFSSGYPFDYRFLDETYRMLYANEQKISVLSRYFALTTIVISCLGLLGLAAFSAERRIKEIGIRKILGSSEMGIVYLLSNDFAKVVIAAVVIALPLSYLITASWLNTFAFRIELQWWYFIGVATLALSIALVTVSSQAILAARANPNQSLKSE